MRHGRPPNAQRTKRAEARSPATGARRGYHRPGYGYRRLETRRAAPSAQARWSPRGSYRRVGWGRRHRAHLHQVPYVTVGVGLDEEVAQ